MPRAAGVVGVHVVRFEPHAAEEVQDASRSQAKQVRVSDVVAAQRLGGAARCVERRRGAPFQGIVRLRERVVDAAFHAVLRVHREIAAVRQGQERGVVVVVLLQVAVQHRAPGRAGSEVVDRHLHIAPVGVTVVAIIADSPDRSHDELAAVHDGPLVHEPGPRAVVVQLDHRPRDVVGGEVMGAGDAQRQQAGNRHTHARYRSLISGSRVSSGVLQTASLKISTSIGPSP